MHWLTSVGRTAARRFTPISASGLRIAGFSLRNRLLDEVGLAVQEGRDLTDPSEENFLYTYYFLLNPETAAGEVETVETYAELNRDPPLPGALPPSVFTYTFETDVRSPDCVLQDDLLGPDDPEPDPPPAPDVEDFEPEMPPPPIRPDLKAEEHKQPHAINLQAAKNQCAPMAIGNSLAYLEKRFSLDVPHEHEEGLRGDESLPGQLGEAMDRTVTDRQDGEGVRTISMAEGKFKYLAANNLTARLKQQHRGSDFGIGPEEDITAHGSTSVSGGDREKITFEWLGEQLKSGTDVELVYDIRSDDGKELLGAHVVRLVGCGMTDREVFVEFLNDSDSGDDEKGLEIASSPVRDLDADGDLAIVPFGQIVFVLVESVTEEAEGDDSENRKQGGNGEPGRQAQQQAALPRSPLTRRESLVDAGSFGQKADFFPEGAIVSLFGQFPVETALPLVLQDGGDLPRSLNGIEVRVNGRRAPLFFAGRNQINFQVPQETEIGYASVAVFAGGLPSDVFTVPIAGPNPSVFVINELIAGPGRGAVQNQDFSLNTPDNPAAAGDVIIIYFTGGGALDPPVETGRPAPTAPLSRVVAKAAALIGGDEIVPLFTGATPGFAGLIQANVVLPADLEAGDHRLSIDIGGSVSNEVVISVNSAQPN